MRFIWFYSYSVCMQIEQAGWSLWQVLFLMENKTCHKVSLTWQTTIKSYKVHKLNVVTGLLLGVNRLTGGGQKCTPTHERSQEAGACLRCRAVLSVAPCILRQRLKLQVVSLRWYISYDCHGLRCTSFCPQSELMIQFCIYKLSPVTTLMKSFMHFINL